MKILKVLVDEMPSGCKRCNYCVAKMYCLLLEDRKTTVPDEPYKRRPDCPLVYDFSDKQINDLTARIAELEEQVWNLNLENERLEEAYWIDETIAPDGTLKPSVRKLLERLEKAETDLRLSDDLVKALDNRIAELEAEEIHVEWMSEDKLPEGISDEVFSAMYACSKVDFVRFYPFVTIDGDKCFLIKSPEVQE